MNDLLELRVLVPFNPGALSNTKINHSPEEDLRRRVYQALRALRNVRHSHPQHWEVTGDIIVDLIGTRDSTVAGDALRKIR